jgi:hypothetical protein
MGNDYRPPRSPQRVSILTVAFGCLSVLALGTPAHTQPAPVEGEKVTVYPNPDDPCPIPKVLAESEFAISCRSATANLLERLHRSDACGEGSKNSPSEACAVLMYVIDDYSIAEKYRLPPTWTVRIGKISHPDNIAATVVTVLRSNSSAEQFDPDRVYELLLPIRLINRVTDYEESSSQRRERRDESVNLKQMQIRYYPALLVGRGSAKKVMTRDAIRAHFETPPQIMQDLEKLLDPRCQMQKLSC